MPRKYPPLTPEEIRRILCVRGFVHDSTTDSHELYRALSRGKIRRVTVDQHYREFSDRLIVYMIDQSGLTREEFYGSTRETARKIELRADEYPIPVK